MTDEKSNKTSDAFAHNDRAYNPPADFSANAHVKSIDEYRTIYDRSISNPEGFWAEQAEQRITWFKKRI